MPSEEQVRAVARAFADALDRNDFERAATWMSPDCRYDVSASALAAGDTIVGPEAILDSYRQSDQRARQVFDAVEYTSTVEAVHGSTAVVRFDDVLRKGGQEHHHHCRQHVTVGESHLIESIVQEDIPSEVTAVQAFKKRVGIDL